MGNRWRLHFIESDLDAVRLTLLNRTMHHFEHFRTVTFHGTSASPESDERRSFTSENGIFTTVDAIHKVLNRGRAEADKAIVLTH